jgi:hypothetical protein
MSWMAIASCTYNVRGILIDRDDFVAMMKLLELVRPKFLGGLPTVNRSYGTNSERTE